MTVGQLIQMLERMPQHGEVVGKCEAGGFFVRSVTMEKGYIVVSYARPEPALARYTGRGAHRS